MNSVIQLLFNWPQYKKRVNARDRTLLTNTASVLKKKTSVCIITYHGHFLESCQQRNQNHFYTLLQ